ncbi:MAG: hypothetical protein U0625_01020 [Phycisphaerales bacterium]
MISHPIVRWLLGLDAIPADATGLRLSWQHGVPAWIAVLALAAAIAVAWASYRRIELGSWRRRTLVALRAGAIALLLVLLAGPVLELPREQVEPDAVLVLADRSRSMEVADLTDAAGARVARDAALRGLAGTDALFAGLGSEHRVAWYGFSDGIAALARAADGAVTLGEPEGDRTLLATAMEQALARAAGRPVSAIVLLTDGRTTDPPDRALLRRLQSEGIAVFAVALGAPNALGDLSVAQAQAPRRAFAKDLVPVEAVVERRGPARARAAIVELVDTATGTVLDRAELPAQAGAGAGAGAPDAATGDAARTGASTASREPVQLVARPSGAGDARWEVRVRDPAGGVDLLPANDRRAIPVTLVDRPMRVLYIEGYPRWEYRYLKNLLQRETTVESAVMLVSADRDFAQEGNTPIGRLPRTREEFERFDLVILGDLPASFFTTEQLTLLRQVVADRGAGLVWIGGARSTPRTWQATPLEDLLPFTGPYELERIGEPVTMAPTPLAARMGVLRLSDDPKAAFPEELTAIATGWSALEWAQRIPRGALKPAAEVLAQTAQSIEGEPAPLVIAMRYGAGNSLFVATDEIWRWRYGRGETYPERFWVQLLRALARPSLGVGREEIRLAVEPGRATVGEAVRVEVEVPPGTAPGSIALEAVPETAGVAPVDLEAKPAPGGLFTTAWTPESPGRWTLRPRDPTLAARAGGGAALEVVRSDRELRDAEADRALLEQIAQETGGRVVDPAQARTLERLLPNRSVRSENPVRDPLWSSPAALILLLLLLGGEWIVRRTARLV